MWTPRAVVMVILAGGLMIGLVLTMISPLVLHQHLSDTRSNNLSMVLGGLIAVLSMLAKDVDR